MRVRRVSRPRGRVAHTVSEIIAQHENECGVGINVTRDAVRAELSLAPFPRTINQLAAITKYSVDHLQEVLDDKAFRKVGSGYVLAEPLVEQSS